MKLFDFIRGLVPATLVLISLFLFSFDVTAHPNKIIILRHGDKDLSEVANHNLSASGLKRALALPNVLLGRFGNPDKIYAPFPIAPDGGNIRSLETISPTAIAAHVNIDTSYRVGQEDALAAKILSDPSLDGKTVFITWEHKAIAKLVKSLGAPAQKKWPEEDFDTLLILDFSSGKLVFNRDKEGLTP
jgi:hypothetical protein